MALPKSKEKFDREMPVEQIESIRAQIGTVSSEGYEIMRDGFDGNMPLTFYYGMLAAYNHCNRVMAWWASQYPENEQLKYAFLSVGNMAPFVADIMMSKRPTWRDQLPSKPSCAFIGHGHSKLWTQVVTDILSPSSLSYEEFNSASVASLTAIQRISQILSKVTFAIIVVSGDDETGKSKFRARQNVIHEIGLFQGALGFERVALLVQDDIEWLSNLEGIQQIRFAGDQIAQAWHDLVRMLKREGQLQ